MCEKDLPVNWPSSANELILTGICSKTCLKSFRKTPIGSYIKKTMMTSPLYCRHCNVEVFPSDIDDIGDDHLYCSYKCRSVYANDVADDETKYERFRGSN
jgi:hypothetical protein